MALLVDAHREQEHDQAEHNAGGRHIEGADLESVDVRGGHVGGGGGADHASGDGDGTDDAVGAGACDLVEHRSHAQRHRLVALPGFELSVFDRIGHRENRGHLNRLRRQIEQNERDEHDR